MSLEQEPMIIEGKVGDTLWSINTESRIIAIETN